MENISSLDDSFLSALEIRLREYKQLKKTFLNLKEQFLEVIQIENPLMSVEKQTLKSYFQAQIDVVEAWLRLIDEKIVFLNSIKGTIDEFTNGKGMPTESTELRKLDQTLIQELMAIQNSESYMTGLFSTLLDASDNGRDFSPFIFNRNEYLNSGFYKMKDQVIEEHLEYMEFKEEQAKKRRQGK